MIRKLSLSLLALPFAVTLSIAMTPSKTFAGPMTVFADGSPCNVDLAAYAETRDPKLNEGSMSDTSQDESAKITRATEELKESLIKDGKPVIKHFMIHGAGDVTERFYVKAFMNLAKKYGVQATFFDFSKGAKETPEEKEKRLRIKDYMEKSGCAYYDKATPEGMAKYKDWLNNGVGAPYASALALPGFLHVGITNELLDAKVKPSIILLEKPLTDSIDHALDIKERLTPGGPVVVAMDHYRPKLRRTPEQFFHDEEFLGGLSKFKFIMTENRSGSDPEADLKNPNARDGSIEREARVSTLSGGLAEDLASHGLGVFPYVGDLNSLNWGDIYAAQYLGVDGDPKKRTEIPKETFFSGNFTFTDRMGNPAKGEIVVGKGVRSGSYGAEYENSAKLLILEGKDLGNGKFRRIVFDLRSTGKGDPSTVKYYDENNNVVKTEALEKFPYEAMFEEVALKGDTQYAMPIAQGVVIRQKLAEATRHIGVKTEIPTHLGGMAKTDKFEGRLADDVSDILKKLKPIGGPNRVVYSQLPNLPRENDFLMIGGTGTMGKGYTYRLSSTQIGGYKVAVSDPSPTAQQVIDTMDPKATIKLFKELDDAVASLKKDSTTNRKMMLLVTNEKVFEIIATRLEQILEPGDIIVDGGNSNWLQTEAWQKRFAKKGIDMIGMGVSGGERGAWNGSAMMAGGKKEAWAQVQPILEKIALQIKDVDDPSKTYPSAGFMGPGGAGHYVKMVHNGIEYVELQVLSETYEMLRNRAGFSIPEIKAIFEEWMKTPLKSYLLEATIEALKAQDSKSEKPLVDMVVPLIEQKGTGLWALEASLDTRSYSPAIAISVYERIGSYVFKDREKYKGRFTIPKAAPMTGAEKAQLLQDLPKAVYASRLMAFAESFDILHKASGLHFNNELNIFAATGVWRTGSILQGPMLDLIHKAYKDNPKLGSVLDIPQVIESINANIPALTNVVHTLGGAANMRLPGMSALLDDIRHYDTVEHSGASLVALVRDYFGHHLYERLDAPEGQKYHHDGTKEEEIHWPAPPAKK